jgi:hypothetical protein
MRSFYSDWQKKMAIVVSHIIVLRHVDIFGAYKVCKYHFMCETGDSLYAIVETQWQLFCDVSK